MLVVIDTALENFFRRFTWAGKELPVVYSGPDRARSSMAYKLMNRPDASAEQIKNMAIPYPWCSVYREPTRTSNDRFSPAIERNILTDVDSGTAFFTQMPKEIDCPVQVDFWFSDHYQRADIEAQITMAFKNGDRIAIPIDWTDPRWYQPPYNVSAHAKIMGKTKMMLIYESFVDNSDLESDDQDRVIRQTFTGFIEASLPHVPVRTKIAKSLDLNVATKKSDGTTETDLTVNIPFSPERQSEL